MVFVLDALWSGSCGLADGCFAVVGPGRPVATARADALEEYSAKFNPCLTK